MSADERDVVRATLPPHDVEQRSALRHRDGETTPDDGLLIVVTHFQAMTVLTLRGEIDAHNANCLRDSVAAVCEFGVPVVLDMHEVTFIDSTGIGALIAGSRFAQELSSSLRITRPSEQVLRILTLTGLATLLLLEQ